MNKDIYFLRWGNLNPIKHKEARKASEDECIHVAPCYKGIYAFPRGYVERFLLGGATGELRAKVIKINGEMIQERDFYEEDWETIKPQYIKWMKKNKISKKDLTNIYVDEKSFIAYFQKPKKFTYKGEIWHHLEEYIDKKEILDSRHGWIKTKYDVYLKALHKCDIDERFKSYMNKIFGSRHGNPHTFPRLFSNDYYEVFIEKVK